MIRSRKFAEGEKRSILIITTDAEAANVVKALRGDSYGTYHLAGVALLDKNKTGSMIQRVPVVAGADDVTAYVRKNWVERSLLRTAGACGYSERHDHAATATAWALSPMYSLPL